MIVSLRVFTSKNIPLGVYMGVVCTTQDWRRRSGYATVASVADNVTVCMLSNIEKGHSLAPVHDIDDVELQSMLQSLSADYRQSYQL